MLNALDLRTPDRGLPDSDGLDGERQEAVVVDLCSSRPDVPPAVYVHAAGVVATGSDRSGALCPGPHGLRAVADAGEGKRGIRVTALRAVVGDRDGQHPARPVHGGSGGTVSNPNRQKTLLPRKTKFYCACDMAMVAPWKKCKVCGQRNGKKRLKK